ncbi:MULTISPECIES: YhdH/YhfP family quinone oxidoreductase [Bordetella]|uniref:Zinc-binding dehydrogenase n=2 Tax=Bordetella TaxID=517 RepID=A0A261VPV2_9BORD|nr:MULTISPECIES: YhdH/YhfP family quinone oxidoreductase [Bordetella]MDM9557648.1 YhdH/YhfP family quinone oxidoreductase [Bordetella petrii]OZI75801.1 zinc-binding dehydrogenase [Bordetella genomosp. 2]
MSIPPFLAYRLHAPASGTRPAGRFETLGIDDLSPGEVVIRVAYAGLNYKDALAAAGEGRIIRAYPRIGGIDLTGRVVASGSDAVATGQEVIVHGFGIGVDCDGGYAEYARVPADWVMPLPPGLGLRDACVLGAAGYTAGLALHWMEHSGLAPAQGEVLVTGATGGVGSIAVDMFSQCGYRVCAMSGKPDAVEYLRGLGAAEVLAPAPAPASGAKPLDSARWAGVVDSVGGEVLARALSALKPEGIAAAFGNAGGMQLPTTVLPFILRGVKLLGINANSPMPLRRQVWGKIATRYRPARLDAIAHVIEPAALPQSLDAMLRRASRGRTVVDFS